MEGVDWNELLVVGVLVLCVLGPICAVLLTQNMLDSAADVSAEHYDFKSLIDAAAEKKHALHVADSSGDDPSPDNHPGR